MFFDKNIELYRPNSIVSDVSCVKFYELAKKGIRYAIIDLDGTLCAKGENTIAKSVIEALNFERDKGNLEDICVVSNLVLGNQEREMRLIDAALQLDAYSVGAYWPNLKPGPGSLLQGMKLMGSTFKNTVVIGDQLLTDIFGGNRLGMYTILVPSLGNSDHLITMPKRIIEKMVMKRLGIDFAHFY